MDGRDRVIETPDGRTLIARALKLRCPVCGVGKMFRGWLHMRPECENCGYHFDRNEHDYFIGAYTINLIVAEMIVVASMLLVMYLSWPDVPWTKMTWIMVACMIPAPVITYPFSKSLWLAIDLMFQPPTELEFTPRS
jgi:uncharacterized protein (DUF983 family)